MQYVSLAICCGVRWCSKRGDVYLGHVAVVKLGGKLEVHISSCRRTAILINKRDRPVAQARPGAWTAVEIAA